MRRECRRGEGVLIETGRVPWWFAAVCGVGAWGLTICRGDVPPSCDNVPAGRGAWRDGAAGMDRGNVASVRGEGVWSGDVRRAALGHDLAGDDPGFGATGGEGSRNIGPVPAPGVAVLLAAGAGVLLYRRERTGVGVGGGGSDGRGGLP